MEYFPGFTTLQLSQKVKSLLLKPYLIKNGMRIDCNFSDCVPFVVPGITSSSSCASSSSVSSSSSSQESKSANRDSVSDNRGVEIPVPERSGGTHEEIRRPAAETENQNRKEESKEVQGDISHELLDWLQEFWENLVDESA